MTNNLANDMTRLCGEIAALRDSRANLMGSLAQTRAEMQAAVSQMVGSFGAARSEMTKETKAELGEFVARVKETVTELRQTVARLQGEFRDDLASAHRAWHGASPEHSPAPRPESRVLRATFRTEEPSEGLAPKAKKKKR
jgi:hypothetical protein